MKALRYIYIAVTIAFFQFFLTPPVYSANGVGHSLWAQLLAGHVANGAVDYNGFKKAESILDQYLGVLAKVSPDDLSKNEKKAYYINLYNASTVKLILTRYPDIKSIKDLGNLFRSPWKKKVVETKAGKVSLDHIEHDILRPVFKDPRIHFAVNCASKSCPPLLGNPYKGDILDQQLDDVTTAFINDPERNYIRDRTLYVSRIFDWYGGDFTEGIVAFFRKYAIGELKQMLDKNGSELTVEFLPYDWSLNEK